MSGFADSVTTIYAQEIDAMPTKFLPAKIVQIQAAAQPGDCNSGPHVQLFALCDDGSVWVQYHSSGISNVPTDGNWYSCHTPFITKGPA